MYERFLTSIYDDFGLPALNYYHAELFSKIQKGEADVFAENGHLSMELYVNLHTRFTRRPKSSKADRKNGFENKKQQQSSSQSNSGSKPQQQSSYKNTGTLHCSQHGKCNHTTADCKVLNAAKEKK